MFLPWLILILFASLVPLGMALYAQYQEVFVDEPSPGVHLDPEVKPASVDEYVDPRLVFSDQFALDKVHVLDFHQVS